MRSAVVTGVVSLSFSAVVAQTGGIAVSVVDDKGEALAGATVTISNETGYVKTTAQLSDESGGADFPVLRPGPGYSVQIAFPGYSPVRHADLRVRTNDTLRLSVQMIEAIQEKVRVTADRAVIDLTESTTSAKFSESFIGDMPVPGRFYQNVLTLAPGVQDADKDGNPNVHGSRERDFSAMVSGVRNVDPLTGQWMSRVNPNSIEELEVITAGAGVEFGRAQGGFARIIQKQGNNEHEGLFEFYYRTSTLDGSGSSPIAGELAETEFEWIQPAMQLTGPILRDKLWYRLSHEYRSIEEPVDVTSRTEVTELNEWTHSDQLTWQVSPRNKLALLLRSDPSSATKFGVSSIVPGESTYDRERSGKTYSLIWTAPYSPSLLIESLVAWQDLNFVQTPTTSGLANDCVIQPDSSFLELAQCRNLDNGQTSGSFFRTQNDHSQRFTVNGKATIYSRFAGATHQFKVGVSIENERYFRELAQRPYGVYFSNTLLDPVRPEFSISPIPHFQLRVPVPESDEVTATGSNWAVYAEDQIKPSSNVTVTAGLRIDREEINSEGRSQFDPAEELAEYTDRMDLWADVYLNIANPRLSEYLNAGSQTYPRVFTGYEGYDTFKTQITEIVCESAEVFGNCARGVSSDFLDQTQSNLVNRRQAEEILISNTNFSPFLAVAWSPWSDGKTAVKAAIGRHYNNIPLIVPLQESEPVLTELNYEQDLQTKVFNLDEGIQPTLTAQSVDRNLKTPYQDEFTIKIEREVWAETSLQLTYINRRFRDQIQDVNTNVAVGDYGYCFINGVGSGVARSPGVGALRVDPFTQEEYRDTDPGDGDGRLDDCRGAAQGSGTGFSISRPDGKDDLYVQNPFWGDIFVITNANSIDYEAWVFEVIRRQFRSWEMQASYTYSRAEGDGEDFFQELGNDPSLRGDISGFQSYDQRHVVKVNATTITPWGFRLGAAVTWQSGLPYSLLYERFSFDNLPPVSGPFLENPGGSIVGTNLASVSGRTRQEYPTGVRNDQRNAAFWNVDLRATKEFSLGRAVNMQLSAEVYNLLNDGTYTIYNPTTKSGQQLNGVNEAFRRFGRRWQLGLNLTW